MAFSISIQKKIKSHTHKLDERNMQNETTMVQMFLKNFVAGEIVVKSSS